MPKNFSVISENKVITASGKTTLVNTGMQNIFLTDNDTNAAIKLLPDDKQLPVLNALYSITPGSSKSLASGTYNLDLGNGFSGSAVLLIETSN